MRASLMLEVEDRDSLIAIDFLLDNVELSKSRLKKLMSAGGVWLWRSENAPQRLRRAMTDLAPGDRIGVNYDAARLDLPLRKMQLQQDETLYSIWQKPSGVLLQGDGWGDQGTAARQIELHFQQTRPVWLAPGLPGAGKGLLLALHHKRAALALQQSDTLSLVLRVRLKGCTPDSWQTRVAAAWAAAEDAGLQLARMDAHAVRGYAHDTDLVLELQALDLAPLVDWAARMDLVLGGFGEDVAASDLALNLDRDRWVETSLDHGKDQFDLLQLDLIRLQFDCPFSGQSMHFELA